MWNINLYRSIDPRTLDEDLDCRKEESHLLKKLDEMEEYLNTMKLRKESYENERFEIFRESVRKVSTVSNCMVMFMLLSS
jgi:hypothetical protein